MAMPAPIHSPPGSPACFPGGSPRWNACPRSLPSAGRRFCTPSVRTARIIGAAVGALIVAAGVCAEDEPPPLDQIKGDLKAAKPGAVSDLNAPPAAPAAALPVLHPAGDEPAPAPPPRIVPDTTEKKRAADSNWLLHAMEEPRAGGDKSLRTRQADRRPEDTPARDSADPEFMLRVYRAQEARDREHGKASARETESPQANPAGFGSFSDMLQRWISPRDLTLFGLEPGAPAVADGGPAGQAAPAAIAPVDVPATPRKPNPFLEAVAPNPAPPEPAPVAALPTDARSAVAPPAESLPSPSPPAAPPASRQGGEPPSHQADDKKYFPQVDRF